METTTHSESRAAGNSFETVAIGPIDPPRIDVLEQLLVLASHKRVLFGAAFVGAALTAAAVLMMAPAYMATAVILPPGQQRPGIAAMLGQLAPGVAGLATGGDLTRSPSDLYMALLSSRTVADGIIENQKLLRHYSARNLTAARSALAGRTHFTSGKDTLVRINVRDADAGKAAAVANAYIDELYKLLSRFAVTESAQRREFYARQLADEKQALTAAETEMRQIQERTGLLQVSSQVDLVIRSVAQLRAEITSREVQLEGLRAGATDQNPDVLRMRTELASLRARLHQLESTQTAGGTAGPVLPVGKVPEAGLEYVRALRQLRYHETLYEVLAKQEEAARIDEAKQASVVQVVDYAVAPEFKSGPRRAVLVLLGGFSAGFVAAMVLLLRRSFGSSGRAEQMKLVIRALWSLK